MNQEGDVLARLHRALVEEIRAKRPEYLEEPFTVAEIYQNLVPYGTHRDRLGIEMNGDYEDALLRMLAGEGGYLILESEAALRALQDEIEASNPNTGLYREYAAVDVRLDPAHLLFSIPGGTPRGEAESPSESAADPELEDMLLVDFLSPGKGESSLAPPDAPSAGDGDAQAEAPAPAVPENCLWCRAVLPGSDRLRFCPFCGTDVRLVPCPSCGEEIEPGWRFCIACGTEVSG